MNAMTLFSNVVIFVALVALPILIIAVGIRIGLRRTKG